MFRFLSRLFKGDSLPIAKDTTHCVDSRDDEKYGLGNARERKTFCDAADLRGITENYFSLSDNESDYYRNYAIGHNCFGENEKVFSESDYGDCYNYKRDVSDSDSDECDERLGNYVNTYFNNFCGDSSENENGECSSRECDNDGYDSENSECEDGEDECYRYYRGDGNYENVKVDDSVSEVGNCASGHNFFDENAEGFSENDDGECDNYERNSSDEREGESCAKPYFSNFNCDDSESDNSESSDGEWDNDACHDEEDSDCVDAENECDGYNGDENFDNVKFDDSESENSEYDSSESDISDCVHSEDSNEDYESDYSDGYVECDNNDNQVKDDEYSSDECDVNLSDNSDYDFPGDNTTSCDLSEHNELVSSGTTAEIKENDWLLVFHGFYDDLHDFIRVKYPVSEHAVKRAIQRLIYNYCNLTECKTPEELNFNDINTCIGYLHRYGICHAAMVCQAMIKVIETSTAIKSLLAEHKLRLVCLGSGPGNDFIGLVVALIRCQVVLTELDVTVVDKSPGWEVIFTGTIEMLTEAFRGEAEDDIASFIEADLVNFATWNDKMKDKLKRAHIVTLVKVLSNISKVDHFETLKNFGCSSIHPIDLRLAQNNNNTNTFTEPINCNGIPVLLHKISSDIWKTMLY